MQVRQSAGLLEDSRVSDGGLQEQWAYVKAGSMGGSSLIDTAVENQADVKVAPPVLKGRDEPYTRQFTQCGEKAEYIHLTPDFRKVLLHEWAHLCWGVFDEYNEDQPFYSASSKRIEATRCTTGITGVNRVQTCQGGSCITRSCRTNSTTKLYEKDCQFFPDKVQSEKASIMFMQSIDSVSKPATVPRIYNQRIMMTTTKMMTTMTMIEIKVRNYTLLDVTEFCRKENHSREALTLQNMKCNYRSTWEVISSSEDFKNSTPMEGPPPPPFFSLLRIGERIVCLVLDVSGSLTSYNRLDQMNQAAKYFLSQIIENRSWVGMVHFESQATIKSELIQINSDMERNQLLPTLPTSADGGTSICSGIRAAFQLFKNGGFQTDGTEILLLSDGEDSTATGCIDEVKDSGAVVHFIALGPSADLAVTNMSILTGGTHLLATDEAQNNGLIDAFGP
ncbi:Calcium-activated chloride channel regulator 4A [Apodemus speciosus]|uniref:Calcium-activated chloride channel regulator 4A n=1 Tax=Apodemus speciosus TaxID=105296 RepID=A0ABQ0EM88_APOSI